MTRGPAQTVVTEPVNGRALIARNLRKRRLALGLSQERLAAIAGLHWTYISSVERAKRNVSIDSICRLAAALGIQPDELLGSR